jgi:hypothetical protein
MIQAIFHRWEQRLADRSRHERVQRPFEWGVDWVPHNGHPPDLAPIALLRSWVDDVMRDSDAFFTPSPTRDYTFAKAEPSAAAGEAGTLTFPSAYQTPHPENNLVSARFFPARHSPGAPRRAVVVLPQWNADAGGHIGLSRLLASVGVSALRISLPYHDHRMPPELTRADYIVSSNVARTLQVCRQAVLDVRRALWWLRDQGYDRLGLLGTSLGSCLAMLTASHEPLVRAQALNHVSPFFADVVWGGSRRPTSAPGSMATSISRCCASSGGRSAHGRTSSAPAAATRCWCTPNMI